MNKTRMARRRAYQELDGRTLAALVEQVEAIRAHVDAPVVPDFESALTTRAEIKSRFPKPPTIKTTMPTRKRS